jgi:hypothetical protein
MTIPAGFFVSPRYRAVDDNGNPISGAQLLFFVVGTSTALTVFSNYTRTVELGVSVTADAGGLFPAIYVPASAYKVELRDGDGLNVWGPDDHIPNLDYLVAQGLIDMQAAVDALGESLDASTIITTAGVQAALALPAGTGALTIYANNATLLTVQGIAAGLDKQRLTIISIGAGQVLLAHQNAGASVANRLINFATSGNTPLAAGSGTATYQYDASTARWRLIAHEQGAWITPTFAAGEFTAQAGNWVVAAGDVTTDAYWLRGRSLTHAFLYSTTTVSATPTYLSRLIPGGFTAAKAVRNSAVWMETATPGSGLVDVTAAGTVLRFFKDLAPTAWATKTDETHVNGQITFEVA